MKRGRKKSEIHKLPVINYTIDQKNFLEVVDVRSVIEVIAPDKGHKTKFTGSMNWRRITKQIFRVEIHALK